MTANGRSLYGRLTRNAFAEFFRDPLPNMFSFAMPLVFLSIFSLTAVLAGNDQNDRPAALFAVVSAESTPEADLLSDRLEALSSIQVERMTAEDAERDYALGEVSVIITVPPGWTPDSAEPALEVQSRPGLQRLVTDAMAVSASDQALAGEPLSMNYQETQFGGAAGFFQFAITGLLGFSLLQMGLYGTASPILVSKRQGVFRRYSLLPMPKATLMAAHVTVRLALSVVQISFMTTCAVLLVGLDIAGGPLAFLAVTSMSAITLISLGYLVGGAARSQMGGFMLVMGLNFYLMMFGQIFADLRTVPIANILIYLNPMTYVSDGFRRVFLGQADQLMPLWLVLVVLVGFSLVHMALIMKTFNFDAKGA